MSERRREMKKVIFWSIAFLITASTAIFQKLTGPTSPVRGKALLDGSEIAYRLARSQESSSDYELRLKVQNKEVEGDLLYRRHKTADPWTKIPLTRKEDSLMGSLPHQPPAGKLEYKAVLHSGGKEISLSGENPVVIRFKGQVPEILIIPHIIAMLLAILFSTRAGIEALDPKGNPRKIALWTTGFLVFGGIILGPLVQKFAFNEFWTGFPLGNDLTDTKTLITAIGWVAALLAGRGGKPARCWVLGASLLLLAASLIPHSLLGSELDYSNLASPSRLP